MAPFGTLGPVALRITGSPDEPELLFLPWQIPLEEWPADQLVALPRGISRHVVRFVRVNGVVYAIKEVGEALAEHEYGMLRRLDRLAVPCVEAVGVVTDRDEHPTASELEAALITKHLQFSLPYRALFSKTLRAGHRKPAARRPVAAARPPAPRGLRVEGLLAVQHVVPP